MKECNCHRGPEVGKRVIGCPPKVININHPQEPVLFHRVDVPAAMGDDTTYPPENGLYKNVLLVYEANNHVYLYNSDGIPTSLTVNTSEIEEALEDLGIRCEIDDRDEKLGYKMREAQMKKIPYQLVLGDKEVESASVNARKYGEQAQVSYSKEEFYNLLLDLVKILILIMYLNEVYIIFRIFSKFSKLILFDDFSNDILMRNELYDCISIFIIYFIIDSS